jgi:hypothetical protein
MDMKRLLMLSLLAAGSLAGIACDDEEASPPVVNPGATPDGGGGDAGPALIPLEAWVDSMVTDDLDGTKEADTTEDKPAIVRDTDTEEAFMKFFPPLMQPDTN